MSFNLPPLPYATDALAPHISAETLEFHHGKHHNGYISTLNNLIEGTDLADKSLAEIVKTSSGGIFNNAAQAFNHDFYWQSLSPEGGGSPVGAISQAIVSSFGSFAEFQAKFNDCALNNFASSWTWLVKHADGSLNVINTANAATPITEEGVTPLLVLDLWEHAYYLDYRNVRGDYLQAFWALVNWQFANENLAQ
ncbi:MAG: Fe-Mn family superoxide dismutase [Bermanella sp.]